MQRSSTTDPNEEAYEEADQSDPQIALRPRGSARHPVRGAGRVRSHRHAGTQHQDDPMAAARMRRRRRVRTRRGNTLLLAASGVLSFVLMAMIFEPENGAIAEYHRFQEQVEQSEAKFNAFKAQHEAMQRRLASLHLEKGREQILIEKGYVRPGERILLFPPEPPGVHLTDTPRYGVSPAGTEQPASRDSGGMLSSWWRSLRELPRGTSPDRGTPDRGTTLDSATASERAAMRGESASVSESASIRPLAPDAASNNVTNN